MKKCGQVRGWWLVAVFVAALSLCHVMASAIDLGERVPVLGSLEWLTTPPAHQNWSKLGKFTVVEFWATWCPPCRVTIPHLTKVQGKYAEKGVTIFGISTEETTTVRAFLAEHSGEIGYAMACDPRREAHRAFMQAFEVNSIPHAFIVDHEGRVLWRGHPMGLEKPLQDLLEGRFDLAAERRQERLDRAINRIESQVRQRGWDESIQGQSRALFDEVRGTPSVLTELYLAVKPASFRDVSARRFCLELIEELIRSETTSPRLMADYATLLYREGRTTEAQAIRSQLGPARPLLAPQSMPGTGK